MAYQSLSHPLLKDDEDDEDDKAKLVEKRTESMRQLQIDNAAAAEQNGSNGLAYTQIMTYSDMYSDPKRRLSLICLSMVLFTYHAANAPTAPLLGQYLAVGEGQLGLPIATGSVLVNELSMVATTWALSNGGASKLGYRNCLVLGSLALCIRLVLITILINVFPNGWALGATQILDGVGHGFLELMIMLFSHLVSWRYSSSLYVLCFLRLTSLLMQLSRRTGHFNLNMGIVNTWKHLGGIVGKLIGGSVATLESYEVAFPVLCAISVLPMMFSFGVNPPDIKRL